MKEKKVDRFFLIIIFLLLFIGVAMFISASLGILARSEHTFYSVLLSQLVLGLGLGIIGMFICLKINYKFWRNYSFMIFLASILLTAAVFIPHLGWNHGGAERWIQIGPVQFQPVEFLKFGFVIYFASWLSWAKNKVQDFRFGMLPFGIMLAVIAFVLLKQPDTKSFILITVTGISMLFVSGVPVKYIFGAGLGIGNFIWVFGLFYSIFTTKSKNFYQSRTRWGRVFLPNSTIADCAWLRRSFWERIWTKYSKI